MKEVGVKMLFGLFKGKTSRGEFNSSSGSPHPDSAEYDIAPNSLEGLGISNLDVENHDDYTYYISPSLSNMARRIEGEAPADVSAEYDIPENSLEGLDI